MKRMDRYGGDEKPLSASVSGNGRTNVLLDNRKDREYAVTEVLQSSTIGGVKS